MSDVDPKSVACPECGAKAGRWCKRPSGHSGPFVAFHARRRKLAESAATAAAVPDDPVGYALDACRRAKDAYPDGSLILARIGEFYVALDEDVVVIAEALGVEPHIWAYEGRKLAIGGVAVDDAETTFALLVAGGYRLVVIETDGSLCTWSSEQARLVQLSLF